MPELHEIFVTTLRGRSKTFRRRDPVLKFCGVFPIFLKLIYLRKDVTDFFAQFMLMSEDIGSQDGCQVPVGKFLHVPRHPLHPWNL